MNKLMKGVLALSLTLGCMPLTNAFAANVIEGNYEAAINEIVYLRQEPGYTGEVTKIPVTDEIKEMIDDRVENLGKDYKSSVKATVEDNTVTFDLALFDVYLDNSEYLNGMSPAGESYFNLLEFYADVLQVKAIIEDLDGDYVLKDVNGKEFTLDYVNEFVELLDDIYNLEPTTNLEYRKDSMMLEEGYNEEDLYGGVDVIATSEAGNVTFTFHMDHHGFWGYELAGDTFMNKVVDVEITDEMTLRKINTIYANFMKIKLPGLEGKKGDFDWYILNNTDLENPYMYVGTNSKGENEALLIDVDFYGEAVINDVIKSVIVDRYGSLDKLDTLYIYLTHLHGDHVNNLKIINQDEELREKVKIIWPEAEVHPLMDEKDDGRDLITLFDYEDVEGTTLRDESRVINMADMDKIEILDHTFQLVSMPDQHTNGGSQLADLNMGILYAGDTVGSQIHLGGTSIWTTEGKLTDGWLVSMGKTVDFMNENNIRYILTGHSPYPIVTDYAEWMGAAIDYIEEQLKLDPTFSGLVVVEDGKVINGTARMGEIFSTGLTDKEVFHFASVNFMNFYEPSEENKDEDKEEINNDQNNPSDNENQENVKEPTQSNDAVQTGDNTQLFVWASLSALALVGAVVVKRKKEEIN